MAAKLPVFPPLLATNLLSHPALLPQPPSVAMAAFGPAASNTCAKCGITFRMTSDLVYHMRTHHTRGTDNWSEISRSVDNYFKSHFGPSSPLGARLALS
jgi:hypothetical protein